VFGGNFEKCAQCNANQGCQNSTANKCAFNMHGLITQLNPCKNLSICVMCDRGWAKKNKSEDIQEHTWEILHIGPLSSHTKFGLDSFYQKGAPSDFPKSIIAPYGQNYENLFLTEIKILLY